MTGFGSDHEGDNGWPGRDHWTTEAIEERKKLIPKARTDEELEFGEH